MCCSLMKVKSVSLILVALMLWNYGDLWLYAQARSTQRQQEATTDRLSPLPKEITESRFDALLSELKDTLKRGAAKTRSAPEKGFAEIGKLTELKQKLVKENEKNQHCFSQLEEVIKQRGLPEEILSRHQQFVREYETKYQALMAHVEGIESAHRDATGLWGTLSGKNRKLDWEGIIGRASDFLEENGPRPPQRRFDPHNLPHRSLKADRGVPPKLTREEWLKAFPTDETAGPKFAHAPSAKAKNSFGLLQSAPPTAADLAETIEVKFTPEITQLANSLGKNPVKIYNWVRNNIEFVPTWGSIQGAQLCMENRAGNAFDTASLLIALFRVSGIPARYQMGTIEVPIAKFINWAGGFTNAEAAASMFASGGVPSVIRRVDQNGKVVTVKLEHVWVKAFIDYAPSGGAVHRQGDTWVELDPSFKQFSFSGKTDISSATTFDPQNFINRISSTATIDPSTGSVTGIDSSIAKAQVQTTQGQVLQFLSASLPNIKVGEFQTKQRELVKRNLSLLAAALPYRVLVRADELTSIPESLRHSISFFTNNVPSFSTSLPELAKQRITLSYAPASSADADILSSLIPDVKARNLTLQDIPTSIPAYLINLKPELRLNGRVVFTGDAVRMGQSQIVRIRFLAPTISTADIVKKVNAGEYSAIGLDLLGISDQQIRDHVAFVNSVSTDASQGKFTNLTPHDVFGSIMYPQIMCWFVISDRLSELISATFGVSSVRFPSAGRFFQSIDTATVFGAPTSVSYGALQMDIDRDIVVASAKNGDQTLVKQFVMMTGMLGSAMEAEVPVELLSGKDQRVEGISTIHALALANTQRIPVYRIDSNNAAALIPRLRIARDEQNNIEDAANAGLTIFVPESEVNFRGTGVVPMMVTDPSTGSASFLVGAANGARLFWNTVVFALWFGFGTLVLLGLILGSTFCPPCIILVGAIGLFLFFTALLLVAMPGFLTSLFTDQILLNLANLIALVILILTIPELTLLLAALTAAAAIIELIRNIIHELSESEPSEGQNAIGKHKKRFDVPEDTYLRADLRQQYMTL